MEKIQLVRFYLIKVIERDYIDHYYTGFFSEGDFTNLGEYFYEIQEMFELPLQHADNIRKNFEMLYTSYESDSDNKALPAKKAYKLDSEKYKKVRNWFYFYRGYSSDFLPI
ncbi:hypothetical protein [Halomonas sp. AOP35-4E-18]|uniref:hypothetical protein n=1 Tax=Halomonas sp. AOP35-4E-18 TaxID=3457686 RepID=UPI004034E0ED